MSSPRCAVRRRGATRVGRVVDAMEGYGMRGGQKARAVRGKEEGIVIYL